MSADGRAAFARIERMLQRTIGLDPTTVGLNLVESSVRRRMEACRVTDVESYGIRIANDPEELQELVEAVVVPETFFFRERAALDSLTALLRRGHFSPSPHSPFRALSVPCSTGEEPYTIAMALLEAGLPAESMIVDGVDVSREAVKKARVGIYRAGSFRGEDQAYRRFFTDTPDGASISPLVRQCVRFATGNVLEPAFRGGDALYHAIFCRNLLIYFDTDHQAQVIEHLDALLMPGGVLFVGAADTFAARRGGFVPAGPGLQFAFRRGSEMSGGEATRSEVVAARRERTIASASPAATQSTRSTLSTGSRIAAKPRAGSAAPATTTPAPTVDPLAEISRLADAGRLAEAAELGESALSSGLATVEAFALLGAVNESLGNTERAERYYRRALFLQPDHRDALLHLALLVAQRGDGESAARLRERARRGGGE
jgi:chemotaxis protein methyltransferase WspC